MKKQTTKEINIVVVNSVTRFNIYVNGKFVDFRTTNDGVVRFIDKNYPNYTSLIFD